MNLFYSLSLCSFSTAPTKATTSPLNSEAFVNLSKTIGQSHDYKLQRSDYQLIRHTFKDYTDKTSKLAKMSPEALVSCLSELLNSPSLQKEILHFLNSLDLEELLKLAAFDPKQMNSRINTQDAMKDFALKSVLGAKGKALYREFAPQVVDFFHHLMDMLIAFTNLNEVNPARIENAYEAQHKFEMYTTILGYPALVFSAVYASSQSLVVALPTTIVTIIGSLAAIVIYTRYFRPCPKEAWQMNNLTTQVLNQDKAPAFPRYAPIDQMITNFESGKGSLIIGERGSGKSTLIEAFAQLVADGDIELLKSAQIFQANASIFGSLTEGGSFGILENQFKKYKKKVVFHLDEIHSLFEKTPALQTNQAHAMLTFCDLFPYVVISTTKKQYEQYIKNEKNEAFLRRFGDPIEVKDFTQNEFETVLKMKLHHSNPELFWDADVIQHIIQNANVFASNTSQAHAAFSLLELVTRKATSLSLPKLKAELSKLREQKNCLEIELWNHHDEAKGLLLDEVNLDIAKKEKELKEKQNKMALIQKTEKQFMKAKQQSYRLAHEAKKNPRKWLQNHVFCTILQSHIETQRTLLGLPGRLNKALIDQTIAESKQKPAENKKAPPQVPKKNRKARRK